MPINTILLCRIYSMQTIYLLEYTLRVPLTVPVKEKKNVYFISNILGNLIGKMEDCYSHIRAYIHDANEMNNKANFKVNIFYVHYVIYFMPGARPCGI